MSTRAAQVADSIGTAICAGELAAGTALTVEALELRTGASRSIVREALSSLATLGLLRARRRIGFEVNPASQWQLLAPEVMRWRLAGPDGAVVVAELAELRALIEPAAARGAASAHDRDSAPITEAAAAMWTAAASRDRDAFVDADQRMHQAMLSASGNSLFDRLGSLLAESLPARAPDASSISLDEARAHLDLADAIVRGDAETADRLAAGIVRAKPTDRRAAS